MITRRGFAKSVAAAGVGMSLGLPAEAAAGRHGRHRGHGRSRSLLIRGGRVVAEGGVLDPGDVLVREGVIVKIAPRLRAGHGVEVIDASGMIVIPGWVNCHGHLWESLVRGVSADAGPQEHRDVVLDPLPDKLTVEDVYVGTLVGALDSLAHGITTVVNWDLGSLTLAHATAAVNALDDAGIRALHSFSATRQTQNDPDSSPTEEEFLALAELTDRKPLLGVHMGTRNPVNRDVFPRVQRDFRLARELGITISLHAGLPTSVAVPHVLNDNGLLGPDVMFVNGSAFTDTELALIAQHGCWIATAPEVEQQSATPTPLAGILAAGIKPTVCTDSFAYVPADMPTQLRMLLQAAREKGITTEGRMLRFDDVFPYGNINPARSLGMHDRIGSLAPGKQADIVLVDTRHDLNALATTNIYADLLQHTHPGNIDTVLVAGRPVKRRGELLGHDLAKLRQKVRKIQRRLL